MIYGRVLGGSVAALVLVGCFSEPGAGTARGTTAGDASTGEDGSTGENPGSTSSVGSATGSGTSGSGTTGTQSTGTSFGSTVGPGSSGPPPDDTTATGDPPAECDAGFDGLLSLSTTEPQMVSFTGSFPYTDTVLIVVGQDGVEQAFVGPLSMPSPKNPLDTVWVFTVTLDPRTPTGEALVTFEGTGDTKNSYSSMCEIVLE